MADYLPPVRDMQFLLHNVFDVSSLWASLPAYSEVDRDTADAILEEMGKLAAQAIAPLNRSGDEEGCHWHDGVVTTPVGFKEAYQAYTEGGWGALCGNPEYGGMGMPKMLGVLCDEMLYSANNSFTLYPVLTAGGCLAVDAHASEEQKQRYLPKFYDGSWSCAMALTEPHCGTDLGLIRTKATPNDDGSYAITGTKIFITAGEHDLTDNIVHLVLAKLPDAPAGTRGISMFIVPKFKHDDSGELGESNQVHCGSLEHKMGIKASATCVMNYDGSQGWLLGEPNRGLANMFTMMNFERLSIGIQGIGCGEMSYQCALDYAKERLQGRSAAGVAAPDKPADPLLVHPDIRRMLLTMRAYNEGGRCLAVYTAQQLDIAKHGTDAEQVKKAQQLVALLTPVCKAFFTDKGLDSCVLGQQVLGGHGYVREWGQEQLVRDARIAQIYEGTNGIQALDLLGRKVVADKGQAFAVFVAEVQEFIDSAALDNAVLSQLQEELNQLQTVTQTLLERAADDPHSVGAASVEYLHLLGYVAYAYMWAKMQVAADASGDQALAQSKRGVATFFRSHLLPQTKALAASIANGSAAMMNMPESHF